MLNKINVPLAKYEADICALEAMDKNHVLLTQMNQLAELGKEMKQQAALAMSDTIEPRYSQADANKFLSDIKTQGKVAQQLVKTMR